MGYPQGFLKKYLRVTNKKIAISTASKKPLFLKLQFNGDVAGDVLRDRLTRAVKRTFNAANLSNVLNQIYGGFSTFFYSI